MNNLRIDNSTLLSGKIRLGDGSYIAQGSMLRSEDDSIKIENSTWVLENTVIIGTKKYPVTVGSKTVFGHKCMIVGVTIGNLCEIGNAVIMLEGSTIGNCCIFGEGTLIPKGMNIPDNSVVIGRPGRVIRTLTEEDKKMISKMRGNDTSIQEYVENIIDNERGVNMGKLYELNGKKPEVAESTYLAETAEINGDVIIGENCKIAGGVKIVGNAHGPVIIGNNVHILENSVLHLLPDNKLIIKDNVTIGPGAIVHGTTLEENVVVESGAIVCDYSYVGENATIKAGSLVQQRKTVEANSIVEGFPAKEIGKNEQTQERPDWSFSDK